jgi:hypothetical protein
MPSRHIETRNMVFPKIDMPGGSYRYENKTSDEPAVAERVFNSRWSEERNQTKRGWNR